MAGALVLVVMFSTHVLTLNDCIHAAFQWVLSVHILVLSLLKLDLVTLLCPVSSKSLP